MTLLCLSDDDSLGKRVTAEADRLSWKVVHVRDRGQVSNALQQHDPDLVLVDMNGGDFHGWNEGKLSVTKPVVFMLDEVSEEIVAGALERGADRILAKAMFSPRLFEASLTSLMKRNYGSGKRTFSHLNLVIDTDSCAVEVTGQRVDLTLTEFKILRELATPEPVVVPRQRIQSRVFGDARMSKRSLDVHVCALRKKLDAFGLSIDSVRGVGYRLNPCAKPA
jgi:DNA-binding response OmpR family regulator